MEARGRAANASVAIRYSAITGVIFSRIVLHLTFQMGDRGFSTLGRSVGKSTAKVRALMARAEQSDARPPG